MGLVDKPNKSENIESIYPLSPMQSGMLFHTLKEPESGVYFQQFNFTLQGNLDETAFERAWQTVVERHPVLRTLFVWEDRTKPLQVVLKKVNLPWTNLDWRSLSLKEREQQLEAFLISDQQRGFQLSKAPLMRFCLIQVAENVYQFIWSCHHSLLDGWSLPKVIKEVFAFYEAFCTDENLQLEPVRPYQDYIAWLLKQDLAKAEVFWRQTLKGFIAPTPLTVDRAFTKESNQHQSESSQVLQLTVQLTEALKSFATQHKLTLSTLVQGAWAILLSRYSGEADLVFGVTVSGRSVDILGVESIVGLLLNTLPMRVIVSPDDLPISLLKKIQNQFQEMNQYEYSPLVQVQQWSEVPRGVPLFESLVVFQNYPEVAAHREQNFNLHLSDVRTTGRTNYPLTVIAVPGTQLSLQLAYDCNRFDADTITRMARHFQTLLEALVTNPQQRVYELSLLEEKERHQLLVEWNNTTKEYPFDKCIHQLFEEQVERIPDAVAVVFEGEHLTYQQLNVKANQLAYYLQSLGVGPEVLVGICVERSLEMIVGLLGILKAGGAYVALDPTYPSFRLAFMLEDTQTQVLLTQTRLIESLPKHQAHIICLDTQWEKIAVQSQENLNSGATPDNLAYAIYTSGSTGKPKGAAVSHRSLSNLIVWQLESSTLPIGAKTLQFAPVSFDVSFQEIFSTWCSGGTLVLISEQMRVDAFELLRFIIEKEINRFFLPFVALQQLAEVVDIQETVPSSLREIVTSGEQLHITRQIAKLFSRLQSCILINDYGPSETHVVTGVTLTGSVSDWPVLPAIGCSIANTQIYILDSHLQPVPIGVPGELHIGGIRLARGHYLNRPDLTALKFIPNPFSESPGSRLYKSGDKVRYLPDGNIEFLVRLDNQVKIRGFRIELGEIEAVLNQHPAVREVVVLARENESGDKRLVAYIVPSVYSALSTEHTALTNDLRCFLQQKLPEYMIPSAFVLLEVLPLTPSGKVSRQELLSLNLKESELNAKFVAPRSAAEKIVADIWKQVLDLNKIGIHDNFFELGGHSLLATQVIFKLHRFFPEVSLRHLFETPTIEGLVRVIEQSRGGHEVVEKIAQTLIEVKQLSPEEVKKMLLKQKIDNSVGS